MKFTTKMPSGFSLVIVLAVLNFLIFLGILILLGGESLPIKANDGRYLLWGTGGILHHSATKQYFEISKGTYLYILAHALFSFAFLLLAFIKDFLSPKARARRA